MDMSGIDRVSSLPPLPAATATPPSPGGVPQNSEESFENHLRRSEDESATLHTEGNDASTNNDAATASAADENPRQADETSAQNEDRSDEETSSEDSHVAQGHDDSSTSSQNNSDQNEEEVAVVTAADLANTELSSETQTGEPREAVTDRLQVKGETPLQQSAELQVEHNANALEEHNLDKYAVALEAESDAVEGKSAQHIAEELPELTVGKEKAFAESSAEEPVVQKKVPLNSAEGKLSPQQPQEGDEKPAAEQTLSVERPVRSSSDANTQYTAPQVKAIEAAQLANETNAELLTTDKPSSRDSSAPTENSLSTPVPVAGEGDSPLANRLPQHPLVRASQSGEQTRQITDVEQTRLVQRVTKALELARNRDGNIRMRLSPPELGSLRLEVKVQGNVMTARIEAETTVARSLLLDNMSILRERLAEQGIRVDQFDVDLMDRQPGGMPDELADKNQGEGNSSAQSNILQNDETETEQSTADALGRMYGEDGQLNVIV